MTRRSGSLVVELVDEADPLEADVARRDERGLVQPVNRFAIGPAEPLSRLAPGRLFRSRMKTSITRSTW